MGAALVVPTRAQTLAAIQDSSLSEVDKQRVAHFTATRSDEQFAMVGHQRLAGLADADSIANAMRDAMAGDQQPIVGLMLLIRLLMDQSAHETWKQLFVWGVPAIILALGGGAVLLLGLQGKMPVAGAWWHMVLLGLCFVPWLLVVLGACTIAYHVAYLRSLGVVYVWLCFRLPGYMPSEHEVGELFMSWLAFLAYVACAAFATALFPVFWSTGMVLYSGTWLYRGQDRRAWGYSVMFWVSLVLVGVASWALSLWFATSPDLDSSVLQKGGSAVSLIGYLILWAGMIKLWTDMEDKLEVWPLGLLFHYNCFAEGVGLIGCLWAWALNGAGNAVLPQ